MGESDPKAKGGFTVTDRRSFVEGGEPRPDSAPPPPPDAGGPPPSTSTAANLPAVDFHTFVLSLGSSALLHLGELEHPDVGAPQKDLPLAKHTIDTPAMLEEKTKGNLSPAEEKLIVSLLYDLRLRFIEAQKK